MPKPRTPKPPPAPVEEDEDPVWGNLFTELARSAPIPAPESEPPKRKPPTRPKKPTVKTKE